MTIDYKKLTNDCIDWIRNWFESNGKGCNAIIGLSGGKDSTIVAALCVAALGKDHVIGVAMPDNKQGINDADEIAKYLGISYILAPIGSACDGIRNVSLALDGTPTNVLWSEQAEQNIPPRIRMAMLYAIAQTWNGRVSCNCNLSESWIGYETIFGDNVGSFAPLAKLTVQEVLGIGSELGIPDKWVYKTPDDGLPHSNPDEVKFGFTYETLDKYIREGKEPVSIIKEKIDRMHRNSQFKRDIIHVPAFDPGFKTIDDNGNNSL